MNKAMFLENIFKKIQNNIKNNYKIILTLFVIIISLFLLFQFYFYYKNNQILTTSIKFNLAKSNSLQNDFQEIIPGLVNFIGLQWSELCLDFHLSPGAIRTASKWQIRQPIYRNSVGRWKIYKDYMAPFISALEYDYY